MRRGDVRAGKGRGYPWKPLSPGSGAAMSDEMSEQFFEALKRLDTAFREAAGEDEPFVAPEMGSLKPDEE
jgi:hypothetical protein